MHEEQLPLITAVIPTYKRPVLLKRAIKSVLDQTFKRLQVCIYDNASGDETAEIVENFSKNDKRVKYFCHSNNIGSLKNFTFGLSKVNTAYFSFLSDDDFFFPDFYRLAIEKLTEYPAAAIFAGNCITVGPKYNVLFTTFNRDEEGLYSNSQTIDSYIQDNFSPWTSMVFRTEKVTPYKLEDHYKICDIDYILKIMYKHPTYISSKLCAVYCTNPHTSSGNNEIEDMLPLIDLIIPRLDEYRSIDLASHERAKAIMINYFKQFLFQKAFSHIKFKQPSELLACKNLLKERFGAEKLLMQLDFLQTLRKCFFIWYPVYYLMKFWRKSYRYFLYFFSDENKYLFERLKLLSIEQ
jgi:glycosyltransferase involved in cell wall biosynthesis